MNQDQYASFTTALVDKLAANTAVLAVVAAGSMAQQDYQPDRWSDHDFFVITQPDAQESFRQDVSWLPDADQIVYAFRETAHGMKVFYASGHMLEFAVFDLDELEMARLNRHRVLLDRANVTEIAARLQAETAVWAETQQPDDQQALGQFLSNLQAGYGRFRRGEQLSAHEFIKLYAVMNLMTLLKRYVPGQQTAVLDNLNRFRRFEQAYPDLGAELNHILLLETDAAARALLSLARHYLADPLPDFPTAVFDTLHQYLNQ